MNRANWASLLLRISIGTMFLAHGLDKVFGLFGGGPASAIGAARAAGFEPAALFGWLLGLSEFGGGLFLVIGLFTRLAVCPVIFVMLVAVVKIHGPKGFFIQNGGFEYNWVILGGLFSLLALGGGTFSVDGLISKSRGHQNQ